MANEKLIYAHEAKAKLRSVRDWFGGPPQTEQDKLAQAVVKMCIEEIDKLKPMDAEEVVRCKDCRWARQQDHREPTMTPAQALICECFMHHHIPAPWGARLAVKPDDFCSYGERRTDNAI